MKTGLVTSDTFQNHDTGPGHPEQIARVSVINENFKKLNNPNILWKKPSIISDEIIKNTHDTKLPIFDLKRKATLNEMKVASVLCKQQYYFLLKNSFTCLGSIIDSTKV